MAPLTLSIVIPTYNREQVLLDTLDQLLALDYAADEIIVVDQTLLHEEATEFELRKLAESGKIVWIKKTIPSIPQAMNDGLLIARGEIVLFLDDDIEVTSPLVEEHAREYLHEDVDAVVGQVVQSWEQALAEDVPAYPEGRADDPDAFLFNSANRCVVTRVMAGNLSVRKMAAIDSGGFDENFVRVAYRFEAEFADRFIDAGYRIMFQPKASIRHLKVLDGGTRTYGEHLTTISPAHAVGRYYYMLVARDLPNRFVKFLTSPLQAFMTRFHLTHPWWIPATLLAELRGMLWALLLRWKGPRLISANRAGEIDAD